MLHLASYNFFYLQLLQFFFGIAQKTTKYFRIVVADLSSSSKLYPAWSKGKMGQGILHLYRPNNGVFNFYEVLPFLEIGVLSDIFNAVDRTGGDMSLAEDVQHFGKGFAMAPLLYYRVNTVNSDSDYFILLYGVTLHR